MPWFKVDDHFWSHPKVNVLSAEAGWLWTRAGSYCAQHLTDGFVAQRTLPMFSASSTEADELVASGLWVTDDGGYRFHDWNHYQPDAEAEKERKEAEREKKREAGRKGGIASGAARRRSKGEAETKQKPPSASSRTPTTVEAPNPNPNPTNQDSFSSGHLSSPRAASESNESWHLGIVRGMRVDPESVRGAVEDFLGHAATDMELPRLVSAVLTARTDDTPLANPTGYVINAIKNPKEKGKWLKVLAGEA